MESFAHFKVGNAICGSFQKDTWLVKASFKMRFPRLFPIFNETDGTMSSLWDTSTTSLSISFRRALKDDEAAEF